MENLKVMENLKKIEKLSISFEEIALDSGKIELKGRKLAEAYMKSVKNNREAMLYATLTRLVFDYVLGGDKLPRELSLLVMLKDRDDLSNAHTTAIVCAIEAHFNTDIWIPILREMERTESEEEQVKMMRSASYSFLHLFLDTRVNDSVFIIAGYTAEEFVKRLEDKECMNATLKFCSEAGFIEGLTATLFKLVKGVFKGETEIIDRIYA